MTAETLHRRRIKLVRGSCLLCHSVTRRSAVSRSLWSTATVGLAFALTVAALTATAFTATRARGGENWIELFDGKTLQGWTARGDADLKVVDGEIHLSSQNNVWVVTERRLRDFELEVEAKVAEGGKVNSGIAFRCQGENGKPSGYQCEIDTSDRAWTGGLHGIGKGWINPSSDNQPSIQAFLQQSQGTFKRHDWNHFRIQCQGNRIRIYTNGVLTTDVQNDFFAEGYFGIQHHGGGGVNRFRRIRVRPIAATTELDEEQQADAEAASSGRIDFQAELPRITPTEPENTVSTFQLQTGFKIELVASEPLIRDPVAIDFDENGRMFVVEFPEYNQKHVTKNITDQGRIRVLDDTDADGVFDRSQIYVDRLSYPSSVACYDGGVFVASAPDILYCKDTDGDDHADVRKVVYTGFGQEFQRAGQAQLNSFRWGLDNRIHVCTSFSGGAILRPNSSDAEPVGVRNRGFLFDPRTLEYEAASGGGQHGLAIDDWGREYRCRNSDPFRLLIYDERYLARNPYLKAPSPSVNILESGKHTRLFRISRDEPWRVLRTRMRTEGSFAGSNEGGSPFGFFTSATGITIYRGDNWPAEYRGTGLVGEVANNLIFRAQFKPDGVSLIASRADQGAEFVASTDNWFRPVQFANGPDGAMYVVDMYRELIEGASFLPPEVLKHINVTGGVDRGRIYRIVADGSQGRPRPQLAGATTEQLVQLLEHRNGWHRDTAARLLYTRQDRAAIRPLKQLVKRSAMAEGRLHALYALAGLNALDVETLTTALADSHSRVRQHAVRLAEPIAQRSPGLRERILDHVDDSDTRVRFQVAFSLGALSGEDRDSALAQLERSDGLDPWFRLAILSSIGERRSELFEKLLADTRVRGTDHGEQLLTELASQIGQSGESRDVQLLAQAIQQLPADRVDLARTLVRRAAMDANSPEVARVLSASGSKIADVMNDLLTAARKRANDSNQRDSSRVSAIRLLRLLEFEEFAPIAQQLLDVRQPMPVQLAAIQSLGEATSPAVSAILLDRWPTFSPEIRAQVTETLCSRLLWLNSLLDAIEQQQIQPGEIDPARIQILQAHPVPAVQQRTARLFTQASSISTRQDVVAQYQPALQLPGDQKHGQEHFRRVCSACHRLEQVGTAVGADLKAIRNRGMPAIMLNILDPNREVQPQFLTYVVLTSDGRAHMGMIQSESANSITIRRPDDTSVTILRIDVEQMHSTGLSFMPEGLEKHLDMQAMADLIAYLDSIE